MRGRKRSQVEKARAVGIAVIEGASEASRITGVPRPTIVGWTKEPQFDELRQRKQEMVDEEWWAGIQLAFRRSIELLEVTDDPVKAATTGAIWYDKRALMRGQATSRTETTTTGLPPEVQRALRERFAELARDRADGPTDGVEAAGEESPAAT